MLPQPANGNYGDPKVRKLNRRRALFVLTKIDEILAWEQRKDTERDTKVCGIRQVFMQSAGGSSRIAQAGIKREVEEAHTPSCEKQYRAGTVEMPVL